MQTAQLVKAHRDGNFTENHIIQPLKAPNNRLMEELVKQKD